MQTEKTRQRAFTKALTKRRWVVRKLHGNVFQKGLNDLLAVRPDGTVLLVEMKLGNPQTYGRLRAKLRPDQIVWHRDAARVDAASFVLCANATAGRACLVSSRQLMRRDDEEPLAYFPDDEVVELLETYGEESS